MSPHRTTLFLVFLIFFWYLIALSHADFQTGQDAYNRGDYKAALKELKPLAEQGKSEAQYHLGLMYQFGRGVVKDFDQAEHWIRLAAEQGNKDAQQHLGMMYEDGIGVPKDYKEAERWYRIACPTCDVPDAELMKFMNEGSTHSLKMDLDGDGQNEEVKEI